MSADFFNPKYFPLMTPWMNIFGLISGRKQVGEIKEIKLVIHANEQGHNKAHLHAQYQGNEVVISIPEGEIISGSISKKQQKSASEWVITNQQYLIDCWNDFTNGVTIPVL